MTTQDEVIHRIKLFETSIDEIIRKNKDSWVAYVLEIPTWIRNLYEERMAIIDAIRKMNLPNFDSLINLLNQAIQRIEQAFLMQYNKNKNWYKAISRLLIDEMPLFSSTRVFTTYNSDDPWRSNMQVFKYWKKEKI